MYFSSDSLNGVLSRFPNVKFGGLFVACNAPNTIDGARAEETQGLKPVVLPIEHLKSELSS